ncbi:MAG: DUF2023 family protein [Candidatus Methanospirareceae archaeon]
MIYAQMMEEKIDYYVQEVNGTKINVFFGNPICIAVIEHSNQNCEGNSRVCSAGSNLTHLRWSFSLDSKAALNSLVISSTFSPGNLRDSSS